MFSNIGKSGLQKLGEEALEGLTAGAKEQGKEVRKGLIATSELTDV